MSRRTTMEFVGAQRRAYAQLESKARKTELINAMCQAFGFDRKYANKLLTGSRRYKAPRGRGRTYSDRAVALFRRAWYATGCMCTKYLKATIARTLANLAELEHVDSSAAAEVAAMSASTMDRAIRGLERKVPGSMRKNRRSGRNDPATHFACRSGERTIAAETEPGPSRSTPSPSAAATCTAASSGSSRRPTGRRSGRKSTRPGTEAPQKC